MRTLAFDQEIVEQIRHERCHHPHPPVQRKREAFWLKHQGLTHAELATLADVSPRSVQHDLREFENGGLAQVRRIPWRGKERERDEHQGSPEDHFLSNPLRP